MWARLSVSVIGLCLAAVGPAPRVEVVDMIDDIAAVAAEGRPATLRPQPLAMAGREAEILSGLACVQEWSGPARTNSFVFHRASFEAVAPRRSERGMGGKGE